MLTKPNQGEGPLGSKHGPIQLPGRLEVPYPTILQGIKDHHIVNLPYLTLENPSFHFICYFLFHLVAVPAREEWSSPFDSSSSLLSIIGVISLKPTP